MIDNDGKEVLSDAADVPLYGGAHGESDIAAEIEELYSSRDERAREVEARLFAHSIGRIHLKREDVAALEFLGRKYISDSAREDPKAAAYDPFEYIGRAMRENAGSFSRLVELAAGFKVQEIAHWKALLEGKDAGKKVSGRADIKGGVMAPAAGERKGASTDYDRG